MKFLKPGNKITALPIRVKATMNGYSILRTYLLERCWSRAYIGLVLDNI